MYLWSLNISRRDCKQIVSDKKNGVLIVVLDNQDQITMYLPSGYFSQKCSLEYTLNFLIISLIFVKVLNVQNTMFNAKYRDKIVSFNHYVT